MKYLKIFKTLEPKKGHSKPILYNVALRKGYIEKTDLEVGFSAISPYHHDLETCVPFAQLAELDSDDLAIIDRIEGNTAIIQRLGNEIKLPTFMVTDYPDIPRDIESDQCLEIDLPDLAKQLERVAQWSSKEINRFSINSVKIDGDNGLIYSTDQICLRAEESPIRFDGSIVLTLKTVKILSLLAKEKIESVQLKISKSFVQFIGPDFFLVARQMEAQYPQIKSAMALSSGNRPFSPSEALDALNGILPVLTKDFRNMKIEDGKLSAATPIGSSDIEFKYFDHDSESPSVINADYLIKYLKMVKKIKSDCRIRIEGPKRPIIAEDSKGKTFMSPIAY